MSTVTKTSSCVSTSRNNAASPWYSSLAKELSFSGLSSVMTAVRPVYLIKKGSVEGIWFFMVVVISAPGYFERMKETSLCATSLIACG